MIVVTGAGGKTGKVVVSALVKRGEAVCALVHSGEQAAALAALEVRAVRVGDLRDADFMRESFPGARAVYHICPNMSPDELRIAEIAFSAAKSAGVEHFVYHSVLHPQVEAMPHHWLKMRAEERLFTSGLPFTILQPAAYMQNVLAYWDSIVHQGIYAVPYAAEARISVVDLEDVAEAAARVLCEPGHEGATYELSGPEPLSQLEVAQILGGALGHPVEAQVADRGEWEQRARANRMPDYTRDTLLKMFIYYENYGLVGSARVLEWLLSRPACRFADFAQRSVQGVRENGS